MTSLTQPSSFVADGRKIKDQTLNGPELMNGILLPRPRTLAVKSAKLTLTKLTYRCAVRQLWHQDLELKNEKDPRRFTRWFTDSPCDAIRNSGNQRSKSQVLPMAGSNAK